MRDALRLGAYQLLRTRVPARAAVASTVELVRAAVGEPAGALRQRRPAPGRGTGRGGWRRPGPAPWRAGARHRSGRLPGRCPRPSALDRRGVRRPPSAATWRAPNGCWPPTTRRRARIWSPGRAAWTATSCSPRPRLPGCRRRLDAGRPTRSGSTAGDPALLPAVRDGRAGVQDEGSQLVALALAAGPGRRPGPALAVDLCAGPGGKAALLAGLLPGTSSRSTSRERRPRPLGPRRGPGRRVDSARGRTAAAAAPGQRSTGCWSTPRAPGWGRCAAVPRRAGGAVRPTCPALAALQRELLASALAAGPPGRGRRLRRPAPRTGPRRPRSWTRCWPAGPTSSASTWPAVLPGRAGRGDGPIVQLWPDRHGTDAMFAALLRRR